MPLYGHNKHANKKLEQQSCSQAGKSTTMEWGVLSTGILPQTLMNQTRCIGLALGFPAVTKSAFLYVCPFKKSQHFSSFGSFDSHQVSIDT